ncbi:hypothetical protein [uncultured Eubacterium sp.]|jgi:hypothetical protein|uniref:hypothetical protein n=1 Tax=uncultured Eubacterium sp. TaxID=165185 RepID=UPI002672916F|nr:hypothetical protein [uncultured Eubacterium sp.]
MDIKVRNVDPVAIKKIDELAKAKGISRNEYLKKYISQIAAMKEMKEVENKYSNLVNAVVDRLEQANDVIRENSMLLENIRDKY